jgi:hypothetical protein
VDCRNIWLRRVSFTAQASLPVESRAGLTGWYSGRENESGDKANIAKTASEARSPASESLNYQLRKII